MAVVNIHLRKLRSYCSELFTF